MKRRFAPQKGKQTDFLSSVADIVIYGGAAGGGKTYGLLLEALRHIKVPNFTCGIFRRKYGQIFDPGGLWSVAEELFPLFKGKAKISKGEWHFPSSAKISFHSMKDEKDRLDYQGSQFCGLFFDEATHFTKKQFTYMYSRNRSTCGIKPYIRATCNPDSDSFVREMIDWWVGEDGLPIEDRSGIVRYMLRDGDELRWFDTKEEVPKEQINDVRSFTFIPSKVYDNKILLEKDPNYLSNLKALPLFEREQLLEGNWNIKAISGMFFKLYWFEVVTYLPAEGSSMTVRYWDRAAKAPKEGEDPDWTVGVKVMKRGGLYYVLDVCRLRDTPLNVHNAIRNVALQDGYEVQIGLEEEGGASGIAECDYLVRHLAGFSVQRFRAQKSKSERAMPASAQAEAGNIKILKGKWNNCFLTELNNFPQVAHDDQVDAFSGAFNMLCQGYDITAFGTHISTGNAW